MSDAHPQKAGCARLYSVAAAIALSASLLVSLLALAPHLNSGRLFAPGADTGPRPHAAEAIGGAAGADTYVRRLRAHLERQPRDARAWVILARLQGESGRFAEAAQAYEKALALPTKVAGDAAVWCEFADALGMTQGGRLAGRPRALIDHALSLDPNHPKALEMAGSAAYEQRDYASALRFWRPLLVTLEPGSQAHAELGAAIARAERLAATAIPAARQ
jgi:cytochrome c-type biogenesis protein CcmH/NrfG